MHSMQAQAETEANVMRAMTDERYCETAKRLARVWAKTYSRLPLGTYQPISVKLQGSIDYCINILTIEGHNGDRPPFAPSLQSLIDSGSGGVSSH